jgi:heme exporter protein A
LERTQQPALELAGIGRRFARRWVLRGVDLRVEAGECLALTGRNGSGKTTLLRVIATLLRPTRGSGRVFGQDLIADASWIRPGVGLLAHHAGLYEDLTAEENLIFSLAMAGLPRDHDLVLRALTEVGLRAEANERVRGFSAGMRRRVALGRLLLRPPQLLLLDEPYASFDVDGVALVNAFAVRVAENGGAVLVATHDVARGRGVLQRRVHLENGRADEKELDSLDADIIPATEGA